jgi:hypothetical protein
MDGVVSDSPDQQIGLRITRDRVVAACALDVLDAGQGV